MSSHVQIDEWQVTVDALEALVTMLDGRGVVTRANDKAEQTGDLVGRAIGSLPEPWVGAAELVSRISPDQPALTSERADPASGQMWRITVRRIGEDGSCVVLLHDVTNMVALEADARQNERVAEMGRLVGHVAHEVRNPLFSMSATLDALEVRSGTMPMMDRYIANLRREVRRMTLLMQDLLEYGKPPVLETRIESIRAAILDAVAVAAPAAAARHVSLTTNAVMQPDVVLIDRARMAQAIQNIVENALQYAPKGSTVSVCTDTIVLDGNRWIECVVEDEGPGFREGVIPFVFEPFYTTRAGGTGLGLSIVRRIVQMHGGQVSASNRAGGGARVTIRLPARNGES